MFCPSCGALAFPRKGIADKRYFQIFSEKKEKKLFQNEMELWKSLEPKLDEFETKSDWREENDYWTYNKPSEFHIQELGEVAEIQGKDYIQCQNPECAFHGPADAVKKEYLDAKSKTQTVVRNYEIIPDSDKNQGVLSVGSYMCPKCECTEVYSYLEQTRSSDEPETRMLTCKDCSHGWREY